MLDTLSDEEIFWDFEKYVMAILFYIMIWLIGFIHLKKIGENNYFFKDKYGGEYFVQILMVIWILPIIGGLLMMLYFLPVITVVIIINLITGLPI